MTVERAVARGRVVGASTLIDTCRIEHNDSGRADATLDRSTRQLVEPPGAWSEVYEGPCLVGMHKVAAFDEGGRPIRLDTLRALLPHDAGPGPFRAGDRLTMLTAASNPALVDVVLWLETVGGVTSTLVFRDLGLSRFQPGSKGAGT